MALCVGGNSAQGHLEQGWAPTPDETCALDHCITHIQLVKYEESPGLMQAPLIAFSLSFALCTCSIFRTRQASTVPRTSPRHLLMRRHKDGVCLVHCEEQILRQLAPQIHGTLDSDTGR